MANNRGKRRPARRRTKYPWHDDMSVVDNLIVRFYRRPEMRLLLAILSEQGQLTEMEAMKGYAFLRSDGLSDAQIKELWPKLCAPETLTMSTSTTFYSRWVMRAGGER